jgi:hypothetical protein
LHNFVTIVVLKRNGIEIAISKATIRLTSKSYQMKLEFFKNIQFTKLIKAEGRLREFNFRNHLSPVNKDICSINVTDDRGNRIIFEMQKQESGWKITQSKLPMWIMENENNFQEVIEEELK